MHPAVLSNIFLREPTMFMPDVILKHEKETRKRKANENENAKAKEN
jgi:hypothetical protein